MKAIRIHQHGGPEVVQIDDIEESSPRAGEIKLRLQATSLNHMDVWVRQGLPGIAPLPLILGCDGSGVVESVGVDVTDIKPGARVFIFPMTTCGVCRACLAGNINLCREFKIYGEHQHGTHRQTMCLPRANVLPLDDRLSFAEGAAFPLVFMTAWHMLVANGGIKPGMDVLVLAGASGVGSAAIQIVKLFGARAIVTVGGKEKRELALSLGADEVIDHYAEKISARVKALTHHRGVDLIFEHVGAKVWDECLKSLAWGGSLVTCGATSGPQVALDLRHIFIKQQKIIGSTLGTRAEAIEIHDLLAQGKLKTTVDQIYPHTEVRAAHERLEQSRNFGKIVLSWT